MLWYFLFMHFFIYYLLFFTLYTLNIDFMGSLLIIVSSNQDNPLFFINLFV